MNPIIITPDDPIVCIDEPCPTIPEPGVALLLLMAVVIIGLAYILNKPGK